MELPIKPPLSHSDFKLSKDRILSGDTREFGRVQATYELTVYQYQALVEAQEMIIKQQ